MTKGDKYYTMTCNTMNFGLCTWTAQKLDNYGENVFGVNFDNDTNNEPIGLGFAKMTDIKTVNITPAASLVTADVERMRM